MVWLVYRHGRDTRRSYRQDQDPSVRRSREQHVLCAWTPGHRTGRRLRWHGLQHEQASPASRAGGWPGQVLYNVCNLWLGRFPKPDFMFSMVISNCYCDACGLASRNIYEASCWPLLWPCWDGKVPPHSVYTMRSGLVFSIWNTP